jgi:hypothetical protein
MYARAGELADEIALISNVLSGVVAEELLGEVRIISKLSNSCYKTKYTRNLMATHLRLDKFPFIILMILFYSRYLCSARKELAFSLYQMLYRKIVSQNPFPLFCPCWF